MGQKLPFWALQELEVWLELVFVVAEVWAMVQAEKRSEKYQVLSLGCLKRLEASQPWSLVSLGALLAVKGQALAQGAVLAPVD